MATVTRRARRARVLRSFVVTAAVAAFFITVALVQFIVDRQPLALLPLAAAITVLALAPWADSAGFVLAVAAGVVAVALACAALAVAL